LNESEAFSTNSLYQYLFYRVARFQLTRSRRDAFFTAIGLLSLPVVTIVVLIDFLIGKMVTGVSAYELVGRWPFGLAVYVVVDVLHYQAFVRGGRAPKIINKFSNHDPYGRLWGNAIVLSFFAAPIVLFAIAYFWFGPQHS
jgi:hypothetical protein